MYLDSVLEKAQQLYKVSDSLISLAEQNPLISQELLFRIFRSTYPAEKGIFAHGKRMKQIIRKLRKAPQPPLAYPGAAHDSDRARRPALVDPPAISEELNPGDRVEGLGAFGILTGELGTVEKTNQDDALVKWDHDGRTRLHQPWLKKVD